MAKTALVHQPYSVAVPSSGGQFSSSSLRFLSPGNGGTEGGVKTIEEDRDEFLLQLAIINSYDILNY